MIFFLLYILQIFWASSSAVNFVAVVVVCAMLFEIILGNYLTTIIWRINELNTYIIWWLKSSTNLDHVRVLFRSLTNKTMNIMEKLHSILLLLLSATKTSWQTGPRRLIRQPKKKIWTKLSIFFLFWSIFFSILLLFNHFFIYPSYASFADTIIFRVSVGFFSVQSSWNLFDHWKLIKKKNKFCFVLIMSKCGRHYFPFIFFVVVSPFYSSDYQHHFCDFFLIIIDHHSDNNRKKTITLKKKPSWLWKRWEQNKNNVIDKPWRLECCFITTTITWMNEWMKTRNSGICRRTIMNFFPMLLLLLLLLLVAHWKNHNDFLIKIIFYSIIVYPFIYIFCKWYK